MRINVLLRCGNRCTIVALRNVIAKQTRARCRAKGRRQDVDLRPPIANNRPRARLSRGTESVLNRNKSKGTQYDQLR